MCILRNKDLGENGKQVKICYSPLGNLCWVVYSPCGDKTCVAYSPFDYGLGSWDS